MGDCPYRAPKDSLPAGLPIEKAKLHPRWRYALEPTAPCQREAGHDGPHRAGQLLWHDPPALFVGGVRA